MFDVRGVIGCENGFLTKKDSGAYALSTKSEIPYLDFKGWDDYAIFHRGDKYDLKGINDFVAQSNAILSAMAPNMLKLLKELELDPDVAESTKKSICKFFFEMSKRFNADTRDW